MPTLLDNLETQPAIGMADYQTELDDAVTNLDHHFDELKRAAAPRLGSTFNPGDYPETRGGLFGVLNERVCE